MEKLKLICLVKYNILNIGLDIQQRLVDIKISSIAIQIKDT